MGLCYSQRATTVLWLDCRTNWELQLKDLKETFDDFNLISYKLKIKNGIYFNVFKFSHEISVNCNHIRWQ